MNVHQPEKGKLRGMLNFNRIYSSYNIYSETNKIRFWLWFCKNFSCRKIFGLSSRTQIKRCIFLHTQKMFVFCSDMGLKDLCKTYVIFVLLFLPKFSECFNWNYIYNLDTLAQAIYSFFGRGALSGISFINRKRRWYENWINENWISIWFDLFS